MPVNVSWVFEKLNVVYSLFTFKEVQFYPATNKNNVNIQTTVICFDHICMNALIALKVSPAL